MYKTEIKQEIKKKTDFLFYNLTEIKDSVCNIKIPDLHLKNHVYLEHKDFLELQTILILKIKKLKEIYKQIKNETYKEYLISQLEELNYKLNEPKDLKEFINFFYDKIEKIKRRGTGYKVYNKSLEGRVELECGYSNFYEESEMILLNEKFSSLKIYEPKNEEIKLEEKNKFKSILKEEEQSVVKPNEKIDEIKPEEIKVTEEKKNITEEKIENKVEPVNIETQPTCFNFNQKTPSFLDNLQSQSVQPNYFTNQNNPSSIFSNLVNANQNQTQQQTQEKKEEFTSQGSALSKLTSKFNTRFQK